MNDCVFCKIINKEIVTDFLYEDKDFVAILDIAPANLGHTLIISKKHFATFDSTDDDIISKINIVAKKLAKSIIKTTNCSGYNIVINNNKSAGQMIPHLHLHIIPRTDNDDFNLEWSHKEYKDKNDMQKILNNIKNNIDII